jgi:hypothetical protein
MPGFDFSNYNRNAALHARGAPLPQATSTGTTIVGCIYDKGVVVSFVFGGGHGAPIIIQTGSSLSAPGFWDPSPNRGEKRSILFD